MYFSFILQYYLLCNFRNTTRNDFVFYADRLIRLVMEEGLNHLPFEEVSVVTPTGESFLLQLTPLLPTFFVYILWHFSFWNLNSNLADNYCFFSCICLIALHSVRLPILFAIWTSAYQVLPCNQATATTVWSFYVETVVSQSCAAVRRWNGGYAIVAGPCALAKSSSPPQTIATSTPSPALFTPNSPLGSSLSRSSSCTPLSVSQFKWRQMWFCFLHNNGSVHLTMPKVHIHINPWLLSMSPVSFATFFLQELAKPC